MRPPDVRRALAFRLLAALVFVAGGAVWVVRLGEARPTDAPGRPTAHAIAERSEALADRVVDRYVTLQRPGGEFPDPVVENSGDYGTAMLGLAMLERGYRRRDGQLLTAGAAALRQPAELPSFGVFELLALARAYGWSERTLLADPFAIGAWSRVRGTIGEALAGRGSLTANPAVIRCVRDPSCYGNQKLVAGLAAQALLRTTLRASRGQALLADRGALQDRIDAVARRVAVEVGDDVRSSAAPSAPAAGILSDPPRNPLAYHALSVMLLGDLLDAYGAAAPAAVRASFDRAGRAMLLLAAPDGDLSYYGRGQGQVWVPAVTVAAAAHVAARLPSQRGAALALADASLQRLGAGYRLGRFGLDLVPGAGSADELAARGLDDYVSTRSYNGLTVAALDRAAALLEEVDGRATALPGVAEGATVGGPALRVAALSRRETWAAISVDARHRTDARYGPGLLSLRRRGSDGVWRAVVPAPALTDHLGSTLSVVDGGRIYTPHGVQLRLAGDAVIATGTWRELRSGLELPGEARWRWSLDGGAVRAAFRAPCRCTVLLKVRSRDAEATAASADGVTVDTAFGSVRWQLTSVGEGRVAVGRRQDLGASAYERGLVSRTLSRRVRAGDGVTAVVTAGGR